MYNVKDQITGLASNLSSPNKNRISYNKLKHATDDQRGNNSRRNNLKNISNYYSVNH